MMGGREGEGKEKGESRHAGGFFGTVSDVNRRYCCCPRR